MNETSVEWWMKVAESKQQERDDALKALESIREQLLESIEYTEAVDSLLDGIIPTRENPRDITSRQLWLKDRVRLLIGKLVAKPITEGRLREIIGDSTLTPNELVDLKTASEADSEEGADWLPYYKAAMQLMAQECGLLAGCLEGLLVGLNGTHAADVIRKRLAEARVLWVAHLKLCGIGPTTDEAIVTRIKRQAEES